MTFLQIRYALRDVIGLFPEGADGSGIDRLPGCLWTRDGRDAFSTVGSLSLRSREPTVRSTEDHHQHHVVTEKNLNEEHGGSLSSCFLAVLSE
jgi:hypothetical protein